jgi:hypothetical protein
VLMPTLSPLQLQPGRHDHRIGARGWPDGGFTGLWVPAASRPHWPTSGGGGDAGPGTSGRAADLGERPGVRCASIALSDRLRSPSRTASAISECSP